MCVCGEGGGGRGLRGIEGRRFEHERVSSALSTPPTFTPPFTQPYRVPTQIVFEIPCVFPVQLQIFPVPIYIICDYYIHKTELVDLSSFLEKNGIFCGNILYF